MEKRIKLTVGDEAVNLELNQAFGFKLAQYLGVDDPTVNNIVKVMSSKLQTDGLLTLKFIVSAGIYGHEFVHSDSMESKYTPSYIGKLLMQMSDQEAAELVNQVYENFGMNLKAEPVKDKKKATRKKKS